MDILELVLSSPYANTLIRQFVLVAASKLSARLAELSSGTSSTQQDRIAVMLAGFSSNLELEIQQRAVEFGSLFGRNDIKAGVLERMPPPEIRATIMGTGGSCEVQRKAMLILAAVSERKPVGSTRTDKDTVVDLIGDDSAPSPALNGGAAAGPSTQDLLADIFGSSGGDDAASNPTAAIPAVPRQSATADIMSLFGSSGTPSAKSPPPTSITPTSGSLFDMVTPATSSSPVSTPALAAPQNTSAPAQTRSQLQSYPAYDKGGLKITLTPRASPTQPGKIQIMARFTASEKVSGVNFQVAVPKVSNILG